MINSHRPNLVYLLMGFLLLLIYACDKKPIPPEYIGEWQSPNKEITVRTSPKFGKFEFTKGSGIVRLKINQDFTASGFIGRTVFDNATVKLNPGNPNRTGIACIVICGPIGKIFEADPLDQKEVALWLGPINQDSTIDAELRYTQKGAKFPMAGFSLRKVK